MLATMRSFFIIALFCLVGWSNCQTCPAKYQRFSPRHSFCLAPNPSCQVMQTGVSQQDKELILSIHNEFRSKVAMGNEHRSIGGSLPKAADMMQMVWDDELAAVAQKWTENCHWGHDCDECREVKNFQVGQNLAKNFDNWRISLTALYNEVVDYYLSWLNSYESHDGPKTGHFTQMIWSRSWRVGCGYSLYKQGGSYTKYYACNYGPGGNVLGQPVYKPGQPCSACPTNAQCSNSFSGLCKMNNPNTAPTYQINQQGLLFYCGASSSDPDCQAEVSGGGRLITENTLGGNFYSIVLKGGQSTSLTFNKKIEPHGKPFCIIVTSRKGPTDASRRDESKFEASYKIEGGRAPPQNLRAKNTSFKNYLITNPWGRKTTLTLTFSVPSGAGEHILDLRKIVAYDGNCDSRSI